VVHLVPVHRAALAAVPVVEHF